MRSKIISKDQPVAIDEKYNSVDVFNAVVNTMRARGIPGAEKIPVVEDEDIK